MFTHIDEKNRPSMVDVADKEITLRSARASCRVRLPSEVMSYFKDGDISLKKGPVFHTAIIAGTNAAKETSRLIPFCHQINLEGVKIFIEKEDSEFLKIESLVRCLGKTGVEMEALSAVSVAALTVYDMCKALSKDIVISEIKLLEKKGGKSDWEGNGGK